MRTSQCQVFLPVALSFLLNKKAGPAHSHILENQFVGRSLRLLGMKRILREQTIFAKYIAD